MKRKTKKKIKLAVQNFMVELLEMVKELPDILPGPFESKGEYQRRAWQRMRGYPLQRVQLGLSRLEKRDLIRSKKISNRFVYQLTIVGKQKLLISEIHKSLKKAKDGSSIVIFDIPEEKRRHRMFLRRLLLKNGFINLQKSVMIAPIELPSSFFRLLEELGIRQNVSVIEGKIRYF